MSDKKETIDTDFLKEGAPFSNQLNGKFDIEELEKLLDDDDEQTYQKFQWMRDIATQDYDMTGFEHVNMYNRENFHKGLLESMERTRRLLSITTAEKLIDFLFIFGYSLKRIIYILYVQRYVNFHRRDVQNYINRNKFRLNKERKELIKSMNEAANSVFQDMRAAVMSTEKKTLEIYIKKIKQLQDALDKCDPVAESVKFDRLVKAIESAEAYIKKMHGIEGLRDANISLGKDRERMKLARSLNLGLMDGGLKSNAQHTLPGVGESESGFDIDMDSEGEVILV